MLKTAKKNIALLVDLNKKYYRSVTSGVMKYSRFMDWQFYSHCGLPQITEAQLDDWDGDGVIGRISPQIAEKLAKRNIATVNIKFDFEHIDVPSVLIDNEALGRSAAEYFLSKGVRHFASFCLAPDNLSATHKLKGFNDLLDKKGYSVTEIHSRVQLENLNMTLNPKQGQTIGVFAVEDFLGRMIIDACKDQQLSVPEDISILGVDNDPLIGEYLSPSMSSIELGAERIGYQASYLLDQLFHGEVLPQNKLIVSHEQIVERKSTELSQIHDELVAKSLKYIKDHSNKPITVTNIIDDLFCGRRVLEVKFKKAVGRTLHEEIRRTRIQRACILLRESDMLIDNLARDCGYCGRERFNAAFRTEIGMTPSQYRQDYNFSKRPQLQSS